ncbi:unnamed protein product [Effrenium voratum]|nr:unnamed protein product [Effrenium voratum]
MMRGFAETILTSRTATYIDSLCEKLAGEHILDPKDLLGASEKALENKLSNHAAFNCGEMGDTLLLRRALPSERSERRRSRSRRPNVDHLRDREARGLRKPALWAAVEMGDAAAVQQLLDTAPIEERYRGWTPLMKAAEDANVDIIELLLAKGADVEATNRRGRGPLSFAAAPSAGAREGEAAAAVQLLLARGADAQRKDADGLTALARAQRERPEAIDVIKEFENSSIKEEIM